MRNREEAIQQMISIRNSVRDIVQGIFDEIDNDVKTFTFKKDDVIMLRSARLRMSLKSLRTETLNRISYVGVEYEGDLDE